MNRSSQHYGILILFLIVVSQFFTIIQSEIIELDMIIDASSVEVHFVRGFLQAPASIDLSFVKLITNEEPTFTYGDDEYEFDSNEEDDEYESSTSSPSQLSSLEDDDASNTLGDGGGGDKNIDDVKDDDEGDVEYDIESENETSKNEDSTEAKEKGEQMNENGEDTEDIETSVEQNIDKDAEGFVEPSETSIPSEQGVDDTNKSEEENNVEKNDEDSEENNVENDENKKDKDAEDNSTEPSESNSDENEENDTKNDEKQKDKDAEDSTGTEPSASNTDEIEENDTKNDEKQMDKDGGDSKETSESNTDENEENDAKNDVKQMDKNAEDNTEPSESNTNVNEENDTKNNEKQKDNNAKDNTEPSESNTNVNEENDTKNNEKQKENNAKDNKEQSESNTNVNEENDTKNNEKQKDNNAKDNKEPSESNTNVNEENDTKNNEKQKDNNAKDNTEPFESNIPSEESEENDTKNNEKNEDKDAEDNAKSSEANNPSEESEENDTKNNEKNEDKDAENNAKSSGSGTLSEEVEENDTIKNEKQNDEDGSADKRNKENDTENNENENNKEGAGKQKNNDIQNQNEQEDETTSTPTETDSTLSPASDDEGTRIRVLDVDQDATKSGNQIMDIVLFLVPADCKTDIWGSCDWVTLGIGAHDDEMEGGMSYCCSEDTAERGICDSGDVGTLIVDHDVLKGDHRGIKVPTEPLQDFSLDNPKFDVQVSGDYVMVIANCDDNGLSIITLGSMEWKSVGGFLPGDIFGLMFFYAGLAAIYFVLTLWYYCGMKIYQESAIPIQKYIFATMILGFIEVSFLGIDFFIWNITGHRSTPVAYSALGLGVLKRGSSRCLGVMVAMGWGVVRDSLGTALIKIIFLGLLYSGLTLTREFLEIAADSVQKKSLQEEEELMDLALVLSPITFVINLIFACWIISSLSSTTEYLRNMNQTSKLRRHMRLRFLIIASFIVVGIVMALSFAQIFTSFLSKDQLWIMEAVTHANYLFILFGVGIIWRPNSGAKDYAMQMEVPALGEGENELELSCVVPSAEDVDDENGFKINNAVAT